MEILMSIVMFLFYIGIAAIGLLVLCLIFPFLGPFLLFIGFFPFALIKGIKEETEEEAKLFKAMKKEFVENWAVFKKKLFK